MAAVVLLEGVCGSCSFALASTYNNRLSSNSGAVRCSYDNSDTTPDVSVHLATMLLDLFPSSQLRCTTVFFLFPPHHFRTLWAWPILHQRSPVPKEPPILPPAKLEARPGSERLKKN